MPPETRAIMAELYQDLRVVLPASLSQSQLQDREQRPEVQAALANLARQADHLTAHMAATSEEMGSLGRSVAEDARDAQREYERGHFERAAFLTRKLTENCIVCHSRLPSPEDAQIAEGFVDMRALEELTLEERAELQLATRRFDDALTSLEQLFATSAEHPAMLIGPLTDYLTICIRVKRDFERPVPVLRRFAARPDLWTRLRMDVKSWIAALPAVRGRVEATPTLANARSLMDEGRSLLDIPLYHASVVHYIAASTVLRDWIETHPEPSHDLAEAYYRLALTEVAVGRNYWVTEAPLLFERTIRLAPGTPLAAEAYALLEQETIMDYEGDPAGPDPEDRERLEELRLLAGAD